ncbi:YicC/YloC family endoribonuclease [Thermomonas sp. XSG]|uniref:YicC/YloC family endoribonuclease n=1 Tax=Thermomonas sp. XSG TaxID=2771436 RepID=UPI0016817A6B|nr:YicC/YloC family endoribonuclease [Thermomonas sp. XSG]QNU15483.1 YicC family protein [Thermomonas sp. XSG]
MIRSMTAFAAGERSTEWGVLSGELRAVNHRFLELGLRLPDELRAFEAVLRERVSARVSRGKLDLVLRLRTTVAGDALQVDEALVGRLAALAQRLDAGFPNLQVQFTELLQFPGVLQSRGLDADALQREALAVLDAVLDDFVAAREREGGKMAQVIGERAEAIAGIAAEVRTLVPQIRAGQRAKLEARLADLSQPADPGRLEQELVIWLQKLDVDEELDRLDSHLVELRRILKGGKEPVGRRLDFLLQEFNREANTLGSKSVDARTSNAAVELKVLIDQIREQIQNIE